MDYYEYPYSIRHLNEILDDNNEEQVRFNDALVIEYCTDYTGKQYRKVNLYDEQLPIGICMAARNISESVREKCVTGKYQGQYDELIEKFEEEHGE